MSRGLYAKLAATNIKNNKQFYLPYLLTGMMMVLMVYTMFGMRENPSLNKLPGADNLNIILFFGNIVIAIFSVIFLFYTNSFIIKRRKKELGIYNILGMEKRHISKVLFLETLFTAIIAICGGLLISILFNKLLCMILCKLLKYNGGVDFFLSKNGILAVLVIFCGIYLLTFIYDLLQIKLANPIELLRSQNTGEKEPKTKAVLAILGVICLGAGYYIAITTENPIEAIRLFFVAVLLVIAGTYCLFTAGSIIFLKMLRKNENYYYQSKHFTAVSGMIYRMKQNAIGLANICILSTMVLVMVSTTVSMYIGIDDELASRYPKDISISAYYEEGIGGTDTLKTEVENIINESGRKIRTQEAYTQLSIVTMKKGNEFLMSDNLRTADYSDLTMLEVITREGYKELSGKELPKLGNNQVVLVSNKKSNIKSFKLGKNTYQVKDTKKYKADSNDSSNTIEDFYYLVVNDMDDMKEIYQLQKEAFTENASRYNYIISMNIDGTNDEKKECGELVTKRITELNGTWQNIMCESRELNRELFQSTYGGFVFLGLFLGSMFLMITVMIIFYKQISEGYEDKERFAIMEKVGMSNAEVRSSIRSQIIIVFFLPIITAVIHVIVAFPMIKRLLFCLNLTNTKLFAQCMVGIIIIFAIIYLFVFWLTSKTYYRIVGEQVNS